ncbi:MAG: OsmC family protein [Frankiaceae bacterium]
MATRTANAHWEGPLMGGKGTVSLDSSNSGSFDVSWPARTESPQGLTSPEELIAAAHASCYSMALSNELAKAGHPPQALDTRADVSINPAQGGGWAINDILITVRGDVDGMSPQEFQQIAEGAKTGCPVSKALTGTTIRLDAALA